MDMIAGLDEAAELFKVLGNESRLALVWLLSREPLTVGALADQAGLSQPLVSQHLRTLRQAGLVSSEREGKEIRYALADQHVAHVVLDAIAHAQEPTDQGNEQ
ncbi:ArsR/SmtB family transcription factor [Microbacterium enclense]|nr:metalloregulator ArsR/SmtB family transcription factor [Microbacterium enclense]MCM3613014.1 metalloregulator ArsR/SmtB family transcription factor [Microbacterium enclense]